MSKYKYEGYGVVRDTEIDFPYHTDDIVELLDEKDQQISDLEHKLEVAEKALELACKEELREIGVYTEDYGSEQKLFQLIEDYKQQAKEMLKNDTSL